VLTEDYNVVPTNLDIYPTKSWDRDALVQPRAAPRISTFSRKAGPTPFARSIPKNRCTRFGIICGTVGIFVEGASSAPRPSRLRALLQCAAGVPGLKPAPGEICSRRRLEAMAGDGLVWKVIPTGKSAIQPDGL
jgi:hypothetical protein